MTSTRSTSPPSSRPPRGGNADVVTQNGDLQSWAMKGRFSSMLAHTPTPRLRRGQVAFDDSGLHEWGCLDSYELCRPVDRKRVPRRRPLGAGTRRRRHRPTINHLRRARRRSQSDRSIAPVIGRRTPRPGRAVERHVSRRRSPLCRAGQDRCGLRPGQRPPRPRRGRRHDRPGRTVGPGRRRRPRRRRPVARARFGVPLLVLPIDATAHASDDVRPEGLAEDDIHVIFFTSGSTGRSKGVMLSHRVNYLRTHPGSQIEPRGATVCMYPLFHMGAWTIASRRSSANPPSCSPAPTRP